MQSPPHIKLCQLSFMKQAIQRNYELVQSARKKLDDNTAEMLNQVKILMKGYRTKLDQLEKNIEEDIDCKAYEEHTVLKLCEGHLQKAEDQLKSLEVEFSDTVPNIVQLNADRHLDNNFNSLHEVLIIILIAFMKS